MKTATATAIFSADLARAGDGAARTPDWVELFPAGPVAKARDGREWATDPQAVIAAFAANRGPLPIDYEHAQDFAAPEGREAPAAGWIVRLEERAGALWGQVEWTDRAAQMIAAREYRFLSPSFLTVEDAAAKDGRITQLLGAGLVNRPALVMTALTRNAASQQEKTMKAIAKALGLAEDAAETAVLARIGAAAAERTALAGALKLDAAADQAAMLAAIARLQSDLEAAQAGGADKAELAAVKKSLGEATAALAALQKKDADREIDAALDEAAAEGKITPASRETYRAMCQAEGGLERFKALARTLPVIAEPSQLDQRKPATQGDGELDPQELADRARAYQDEQRKLGRSVSISAAVAHVQQGEKK
jgi:phage I-like protein